jgi:hypothetical protein
MNNKQFYNASEVIPQYVTLIQEGLTHVPFILNGFEGEMKDIVFFNTTKDEFVLH